MCRAAGVPKPEITWYINGYKVLETEAPRSNANSPVIDMVYYTGDLTSEKDEKKGTLINYDYL